MPVNSFYVFEHKRDADGKPVYCRRRTATAPSTTRTSTWTRTATATSTRTTAGRSTTRRRSGSWATPRTWPYGKFDLGFTLRAYLGNYVYNNVASNLGTYAEVTRGVALQPAHLGAGDRLRDAAVPVGLLRRGCVVPPDGQHHPRLHASTFAASRRGSFGTVQNAFTITGYSGVDPTAGLNGIDNNIYPRSRTFTGGLSLGSSHDHGPDTSRRDGDMNRSIRKALAVAILLVGWARRAAPTPPVSRRAPSPRPTSSTIPARTGLPRAGLRRSGRQRAAGARGQAGHLGHRRGILAVPPPVLGGAGAADRRGGDRLGRRRPARDEHPALGRDPTPSSWRCTTGSSSRSAWRTSSCARPPTTSWTSAERQRGAPGRRSQTYRAEARFLRALSYWHGIDLFGDIPLVTEEDAAGRHAAAAGHPRRALRLRRGRADRHPGGAAGRRARPATAGRPTRRRRCCWPSSI